MRCFEMASAQGRAEGSSGSGSLLPFQTPDKSGLPSDVRGAGPVIGVDLLRTMVESSSPGVPRLAANLRNNLQIRALVSMNGDIFLLVALEHETDLGNA